MVTGAIMSPLEVLGQGRCVGRGQGLLGRVTFEEGAGVGGGAGAVLGKPSARMGQDTDRACGRERRP